VFFIQLLKFRHLALEWKYTSFYHACTRVSARGGWGISPPTSNDSRGMDITPELGVFLGNVFCGFEKVFKV
jgi:hypothetical protein